MDHRSRSYPTVAAADVYKLPYGLVARYGHSLIQEGRGEDIGYWGRKARAEMEETGILYMVRMRLLGAYQVNGMVSREAASAMASAS